jgi:hypothetical protein
VQKTVHGLDAYNQFGLYHDDLYVEDEDVEEALRRLPPQLQVIEI